MPQARTSRAETKRLKGLTFYEGRAREKGYQSIAGVDEAGRGPLAGPVVAAACILPEGMLIDGIDDSKKLTPAKRYEIFQKIASSPDIFYGVGIIDSVVIDQINILQATFQAMIIALAYLHRKPDYILVDGPHLPPTSFPGEGIIDGDALSQSIAAASIIAKETRDRIMLDYHALWPQYQFDLHKGYGTQKHLEALEQFGPCPIHRATFEPIKSLIASVKN